jgi:phosphoglycerate dehydrogenase-like enzyme
VDALLRRRIAGVAVDVFDVEPLAGNHPFRTLDKPLAMPHLGYVTEDLYRIFCGDTVRNIVNWLDQEADEIDILRG